VYFLEKGASQRPSKVIYDRAGSAIAEADAADFDWERIFTVGGTAENAAAWFHFTGITPALSDNAAAACMEACKTARKQGAVVSCDLNYRKNLWTRDKARSVMTNLMPFVDVCIANEEDAADVFGIHAPDTDINGGVVSREGYKIAAKRLADEFGFKKVAITLRESFSANDNNWAAMLYDGADFFFSKTYAMRVVDRVGGGDSFAAGLIYALLQRFPLQNALEFASAASCLKHSIEGDFNCVSLDEVTRLASGASSSRIVR
jgi:2-dehydro-3-deoxygluconokinase